MKSYAWKISDWRTIYAPCACLLMVMVAGFAISTSASLILFGIAGVVLLIFALVDPALVLLGYIAVSVLEWQPVVIGLGLTIQNVILICLLISVLLRSNAIHKFFQCNSKGLWIWIAAIAILFVWTVAFPSIGSSMMERLIEFKRRVVFLITFFLAGTINMQRRGGLRGAVRFVEILALGLAAWSLFGYSRVSATTGIEWELTQQPSISYWIGTAIGPIITLGASLVLVELLYLLPQVSFRTLWRFSYVGLCGIAILLTYERGMAILFTVGLVSTGLAFTMRQRRLSVAFLAFLSIPAMFIGLLSKSPAITGQLTDRWADLINASSVAAVQHVIQLRYQGLASDAWKVAVRAFPLGIGFYNSPGMGIFPHNQYVLWLVEVGLVGLFCYLLLIGHLGLMIWFHVKSETSEKRRQVALALFGTLVGMVVYLVFNDYFFTNWLYLFLLLFGLLKNPFISSEADSVPRTLSNSTQRST